MHTNIPENDYQTGYTQQPGHVQAHLSGHARSQQQAHPNYDQWAGVQSPLHSPGQHQMPHNSTMTMSQLYISEPHPLAHPLPFDTLGYNMSSGGWSANAHSQIPSFESQAWDNMMGTMPNMIPYDPHTILPAEAYASEFSPVSSSSSSPSPSYVTGHRSSSSPSMGVSQDPQRGGGEVKRCSHCQATSTPLWRREPSTQKPLCNACGLYLQQRNKLRPQELIDADADDDESPDIMENPTGPECSHCHTRQTSVWRRSKTGEQLCNACGVYIRLRGVERPLSLKRKKIKPRSKHSPK